MMLQLLDWVKRLERKTALTTHPQDSVVWMVLRRLRVLLVCVVREVIQLPVRRRATKNLRRQRKSKGDREALVLGNGPTIKRIDWSKLSELKTQVDVFVVNWFVLSNLQGDFIPDYVVLSDPAMVPGCSKDIRNKELWERLGELKSTNLVVPIAWYRILNQDPRFSHRTLYFVDTSLEGWWNGISPIWPRGYASLTAYKALAISNYLGYRKISILGIDNTMFYGLRVSETNELLLSDHHFYDSKNEKNLDNFFMNGVADFFYDLSICFMDLKSCFSNLGHVVNLDESSLVDAFRKSGRDVNFLIHERGK